MSTIKNSVLVKNLLEAMFEVSGRRTSFKTAEENIGSAIKTLERKYRFLKSVTLYKNDLSDGSFYFYVSEDLDIEKSTDIGKFIESFIRVIYADLDEEAGLYFITELKEHLGKEIATLISLTGIDLEQIQVEQHHTYRRLKRKKTISQAVKTGKIDGKNPDNLLGYTWKNVGGWKHDKNSKYCTLYDKNGNVLDRLDLDRIIQNYVEKLSDYVEHEPAEIEKQTRIYEKEYNLLKLMMERDMDAETAMHMLGISREELDKIISKLSEMELLQYADYDTLELTKSGINYLSQSKKEKSN